MAAGGTLSVTGGDVTNNGTVRLERGAQLVVGGSGTLTNNGTLDVITGGLSLGGGGLVNHGVVLDSSVVQVTGVSRNAR